MLRFLSKRPRSQKTSSPNTRRALLRVEQLEARLVPYALSGNAWAHPQVVTVSFVPDGTNLGGVSSNLFATFNAKWATSIWQAQILRGIQVWAQQTNVNFSVIADNGGAIGSGDYQQGDPGFGDIRIGGYNFGAGTLAVDYLPPPENNYSIAGDIQFNTVQVFNIGNTYDLWTVSAHEFGHALGLLHSATSLATMYGAYNTRKVNLHSDDIAGVQAIYGGARQQDSFDAAAANGTFATASNLSGQIDATTLTALVQNLDITTISDADFYTFTAPSGTNSSFTATIQSKGLSLLGMTATVYAANQTTVLGTATGTDRTGNTLTLTVNNVSVGQQFYLKVAAADTSAFGTGTYALTLNFGTGASPTVPLPNTQTLNGNPLTSGGGQADSPPPADSDSPGRDIFDNPTTEAHVPAVVSAPAVPSQPRLELATLFPSNQSVPPQTTPATFVAHATTAAPVPVVLGNFSVAISSAALSGGDAAGDTKTTAQQPVHSTSPTPASPELLPAPSAIAPVDDAALHVPACDACFAELAAKESTADEASIYADCVPGSHSAWMAQTAVVGSLALALGGYAGFNRDGSTETERKYGQRLAVR